MRRCDKNEAVRQKRAYLSKGRSSNSLAINPVTHVLPASDVDWQSAKLSSTESDSDRRLDELWDRDPFLLGSVTITQRHSAIFKSVKIHSDAERRTNLHAKLIHQSKIQRGGRSGASGPAESKIGIFPFMFCSFTSSMRR